MPEVQLTTKIYLLIE